MCIYSELLTLILTDKLLSAVCKDEDCFLIGHQRAKWMQLQQAYDKPEYVCASFLIGDKVNLSGYAK